MRKNLLFIGHDRDFAGALGDLLEPSGYDTVAVRSVADALARLRAGNDFHALALDVPSYDPEGNRFVGMWRTGGVPKLPLVILSSHPEKWFAPGRGSALVRKPIQLQDLLAALDFAGSAAY